MQPLQQEDLYEVICERYEKKAMIITSNRDLSEWAYVFSNPSIGSAAMDDWSIKALKLSSKEPVIERHNLKKYRDRKQQ